MNPMQKSYRAFIESVCAEFECTGAIRPLQEGFSALCENMTPGNMELVRYFRNLPPSRMPKGFSERDSEVFSRHNPHFDRWVVHNSDNAQEIYENGFRYGSEPGKLAYTDHCGKGRFAFATPLENATPPDFGNARRLPYCDSFDVGGSIVFKASGVTAYHRDDREDQVIFDKDSPEGCFWIRNVNYGAWKRDAVDDDLEHELVDRYEVVGKNPDRPLCTGTYDRCIRWCRDNGDAYAHMMKRWNTAKTESMVVWDANSLCESGDRTSGSAWDGVEWIHVYHAADPRLDKDIKLDSLWATGQKDSVTREDVIGRFIEDAEDFNKWLATSEDGGAFITSASIKFKDDQGAITVDIPCPGGVTPYKHPTSTLQVPGKLDNPWPGDGQSADNNTHGNNLYESVEDTALTQFGEAMVIAKDSYDRSGGMDYEPEEGEDEESKYAVVKDAVDCIYGEMDAQLKSKGTVTVYRALHAKEAKDIRMDYLGESWSLYEDAAIEFGSHNGSNFILKAEAGLDAIDLERTWAAAGACADLDEYEVCIEDTDRLRDLQIGRIVKRTAVYDVNDRMGSDYREIGVDTKFVPQENQSSGCPDGECQLRQPTTNELYKFIMKATKEEHQLRGDWDSNHEEIGADSDRFIKEIQAGEVQSLTDGKGLVTYGLDSGKMIIYDLYVLPEYRNAGVGGTLLDKVTEMAGGRPVALTVNSMNVPAIQLYRNHGFREVGTVSYNGVDLLRMERKREKRD